jgi:serine-type D-Ala-D-Ala carboxypeptidase/endopeptidase (penicillin-binding protein 4)
VRTWGRGGRAGVRRLVATSLVAGLLVACAAAPSESDPPEETPSAEGDAGPAGDDAEVLDGGAPGGAPSPGDAPPEPDDAGEDLAGEPAPPAAPEPPPPPPTRTQLVADVRGLVATALEEVVDATLVVLVVDEHGRELVAHEPDRPVLPASTTKIVTAAAALTTLGADTRLPTHAETTGRLGADGVLDGELLLVGSGDPVLATDEYVRWIYPARPYTRLSELADAIVATGVERIEGDVVGISDAFPGARVPFGWPDEYFASLDARYVDGLTVDAGLRTIVRYPDPEDDEPDADGSDAEGSGTDAGDDEPDAVDADGEGEPGDEPEGATDDGPDPTDLAALERELGTPTVRVDHAPDPRLHAVRELIRLLEDRGVEVAGEARAGRPSGPATGRLATIHSPTIEELLVFAVRRSDNHISDQLFRLVARTRTGAGSWYRGDRAVRQVLDRLGVEHDAARFADGSGLSRDDRVTARLLIDLDRAMQRSQHRLRWADMMAVTGVRGTLEQRLAGTPGVGRFHGKTGSLKDVNSLVGTVSGPHGRAYHLAVLVNDAPGGERWVARQLQDDLVLRLVADLDQPS